MYILKKTHTHKEKQNEIKSYFQAWELTGLKNKKDDEEKHIIHTKVWIYLHILHLNIYECVSAQYTWMHTYMRTSTQPCYT